MITKRKAGKLVVDMERQFRRFDAEVIAIQRKANRLSDQIANIVKCVVGRDFPDRKQWIMYPADGWKCEKYQHQNAFPMCVYDEGEDPALDHCLFCGEPYERK